MRVELELRGQVLNLDINRIENKQIRNVKNKDLTPFLAWKRHKDKIRGNSVTYEAFKNLLRKLVDLQNPQAIEIQQNLAF